MQNQFDSIDLSDNAIVRLEGFPKLPRLKVLHLNNNRINRIARHLEGGLALILSGSLPATLIEAVSASRRATHKSRLAQSSSLHKYPVA